MILIYVCLVIVQLASSSRRTIDLHHDSEDHQNGQIAHFLLPLLGSDVKDDIKVEVVPYRDYKNNKKSKIGNKPVAITNLGTKKKDLPLAGILADAKYRNSAKDNADLGVKDKRKFIKQPFWESVEDKSSEDDSRSESSIIIHVKRKKENVTKGEKVHADNKHSAISEESEDTISEESSNNEHVPTHDDHINTAIRNIKIHKYNPHPYYSEESGSSKEISHIKHNIRVTHHDHDNDDHLKESNIIKIVPKEESNMHKLSKEVHGSTDSWITKPTPDELHDKHKTVNYLSDSSEASVHKLFESHSNEEIHHTNAEKLDRDINVNNKESSSTVETEESDSAQVPHHKNEQYGQIISTRSKELNTHKQDHKYHTPKEESATESESSEQIENKSYDQSISSILNDNPILNRHRVDKSSSSQANEEEEQHDADPLRHVKNIYENYEKHYHKDNFKIDAESENKSASSDKIIKEIYHPNLHFETKPYLIHKNSHHRENSTKSSKKVDGVSSNDALMKAYKLLFNKKNDDQNYHFEIMPNRNVISAKVSSLREKIFKDKYDAIHEHENSMKNKLHTKINLNEHSGSSEKVKSSEEFAKEKHKTHIIDHPHKEHHKKYSNYEVNRSEQGEFSVEKPTTDSEDADKLRSHRNIEISNEKNAIEYGTSSTSNESNFKYNDSQSVNEYKIVTEPSTYLYEGDNAYLGKERSAATEVSNKTPADIHHKKYTPSSHEVHTEINHVNTVPAIVLLKGGKVVEYEAPEDGKIVKKSKNNQSENKDIEHEPVRNAGIHQFDVISEPNNDNKSSEETGEESNGDVDGGLVIAEVSYRRDYLNSDDNKIDKDPSLEDSQKNNSKEHVNVNKDEINGKKKSVLHPVDMRGLKLIDKQIDAIASYVKKRTLLEAKRQNHGSKSYNLSFLFNRR